MNQVIPKGDDPQQAVTVHTPTPLEIFAKAMDKGISLEQIRELREMVEWHDKREAEKAYNAAMAKFRSEVIPIIKTRTVDYRPKTGGRVVYDHETLDVVLEVAVPKMAPHGLYHHWKTVQESGQIHVTCVIAHEQGHSEGTTLSGAPDTSGSKNSIQAIGSTVKYLERYTFMAAAGLAAKGQDNDGAGAAVNGNGNAMPTAITESQVKELDKLIKATGTSLDSFLAWTGAGSLQALPPARFKDAHEMLLRRKQLQEAKAKEAAQ